MCQGFTICFLFFTHKQLNEMVRLMFYAITSYGIDLLQNHFNDETIFIHSIPNSTDRMQYVIKDYTDNEAAIRDVATLYGLMMPGAIVEDVFNRLSSEYEHIFNNGYGIETAAGILIQPLATILTF